jgi:hypothetical protein
MIRSYPVSSREKREKRGERDPITAIRRYVADSLVTFQSLTQETPLWLVIQSFGDEMNNGVPKHWNVPTANQLRLMVNLSLGRGLKALTYFCWKSGPTGPENIVAVARYPYIPQDDLYGEVCRLNAKINALGPLLASLKWVKQIPQQTDTFDVQLLEAPNGRQFVWVTNWSYDKKASGKISLPGGSEAVSVSLDPGDSKMIELR